MTPIIAAFIAGIALSAITVAGDALIKQASLKEGSSGWQMLLLGAIIYGATAFGWFFVMKKIKLSTLGVLYGVSTIIFLIIISIFFFKERLTVPEIIGILFGITSLILLAKFA